MFIEARHRILNSTATSTITSTGVPCRRAAAKRHWRTACTARSLSPDAESLQHLHVADRSVPPDHDLQDHVADDAALTGLFRIVRFHFAQQPRRFDPAAASIRTAADPTARSGPDSGAVAFADACAGARAHAVAPARSVAVGFGVRLHENADAIPRIGGS